MRVTWRIKITRKMCEVVDKYQRISVTEWHTFHHDNGIFKVRFYQNCRCLYSKSQGCEVLLWKSFDVRFVIYVCLQRVIIIFCVFLLLFIHVFIVFLIFEGDLCRFLIMRGRVWRSIRVKKCKITWGL